MQPFEPQLHWQKKKLQVGSDGSFVGYDEATIGNFPDDGVRFSITLHPTCHRRGPIKLLVEVGQGSGLLKWGCFDDQDHPTRYYHHPSSALDEAQAIARALCTGRNLVMERERAGKSGENLTPENLIEPKPNPVF